MGKRRGVIEFKSDDHRGLTSGVLGDDGAPVHDSALPADLNPVDLDEAL
jgi:hypothetical protein